jgi:hypothetical protein
MVFSSCRSGRREEERRGKEKRHQKRRVEVRVGEKREDRTGEESNVGEWDAPRHHLMLPYYTE